MSRKLPPIQSIGELLENIAYFNREMSRHANRCRVILRSTEDWVYDQATNVFGPNKFIGYAGMTFGSYDNGSDFYGGVSKNAIEQITGKRYEEKSELSDKLRNWAESGIGSGAFGNSSSDKWKFIIVERSRLHTDSQDNIAIVYDDIREILRGRKGPTSRKAMVAARLGQGQFRIDVLGKWQNACAVTKVGLPEIIRASHIKPWKDSDNVERLDPNNGLPLIANLDALFDAGFITFDDNGSLLISPRLSPVVVKSLNLENQKLVVRPNPESQKYLAFHRSAVFLP